MSLEHGNLSIHTENIFPIIKKWLYSDHDIFVRELVSNACDAIHKLKKLNSMGEANIPEDTKYKVEVILDKENKTIQIIDNGIGMTEEEIKKYINQIAFSGAEDFVQKYKDKTDGKNEIIGHFGLGFYSSFMVADKVQIDTLSYQKDAKACRWICEGGTDYALDLSDRNERGTTITLFIGEDGKDFLDIYTLRKTLEKYCSFMAVEIYLKEINTKEEDSKEEDSKEEPKPINDPQPLWLKDPKECTDEEYKAFYKKVFFDYNDPLFWIHLNMEYPFNLKGILYFPKLKHEFETIEGQIKLFNNQVFVADNIKEVIPEFLLLLKGTLDCPDLPLNVSRSFLQNDGYVKKISNYIVKKVGDKLTSIYKKEKEQFEKFWDDIHPFIKFGCLKDDKFYEKTKDILLFKTIHDKKVTLKEYLEENKEKHENKVFYVTDEKQQSQYVNLFKEQNLDAVILSSSIDSHFISFLEMKEENVSFQRIDADLSESLKENEAISSETSEKIENIFKANLNKENVKIKVENLKSEKIASMLLLSEQSRRMQEMMSMYGNMGMMPGMQEEQTLVINQKHPLIQKLISSSEKEDAKETNEMICSHLYDLALMSHKPLDPNSMTAFIERSNNLLLKLAQ